MPHTVTYGVFTNTTTTAAVTPAVLTLKISRRWKQLDARCIDSTDGIITPNNNYL